MATDAKRMLRRGASTEKGRGWSAELKADLKQALSPDNLSAAFLQPGWNDSHGEDIDKKYTGLDMTSLREVFKLYHSKNNLLKKLAGIIHQLYKDFGTTICRAEGPDVYSSLRAVVILLECPALRKPDESWSRRLVVSVATALLTLKKKCPDKMDVLGSWWKYDSELFQTALDVFLGAFKGFKRSRAYSELSTLTSYTDVLALLYQVNISHGGLVPVSRFYTEPTISMTHRNAYWQKRDNFVVNSEKRFTLLDYPFLLELPVKWELLKIDTELTHKVEEQDALRVRDQQAIQNLQRLMLGLGVPQLVLEEPELNFKVDRSDIVQSARSNVRKMITGLKSYRKRLTIHFDGDIALGVYGGGPMKEFFHDIFHKLETHSIFMKANGDPACKTLYLNKEFEDKQMLREIGILFTLALYNHVTLTLPFPLLFYKKLLVESTTSFEDLELLDPDLAKSVGSLRTMSDEDLAVFQFAVDTSGGNTVELLPGGAEIAVTLENVDEYIELYSAYLTSSSQFKVFRQGFIELFNMDHLNHLFRPEELMALFMGPVGGVYNWKEFEESIGYEGEYQQQGRHHPVIKMFWEVFHSFTEDVKRNFLGYWTGAPIVPFGGFKALNARIRPLGDTNNCKGQKPGNICPEVNTCQGYVVLHLPMYNCVEDVRVRLLKVLELNSGFHKIPTPEEVRPRPGQVPFQNFAQMPVPGPGPVPAPARGPVPQQRAGQMPYFPLFGRMPAPRPGPMPARAQGPVPQPRPGQMPFPFPFGFQMPVPNRPGPVPAPARGPVPQQRPNNTGNQPTPEPSVRQQRTAGPQSDAPETKQEQCKVQ